MITHQGGDVFQTDNRDNIANVQEVRVTQKTNNTATWVVLTTAVPRISNFTKGMKLTYNAKGTRNPNADNALEVTNVDGPSKYTCNGGWPINT
ncbi:hypothetical protein [Dapis sp. BLCC M229]|uniref:hypothetical protein n=1 Tax=Dapis sp. BLCC M229 TaxID=3400188 RepID=UPI003CF22CA1